MNDIWSRVQGTKIITAQPIGWNIWIMNLADHWLIKSSAWWLVFETVLLICGTQNKLHSHYLSTVPGLVLRVSTFSHIQTLMSWMLRLPSVSLQMAVGMPLVLVPRSKLMPRSISMPRSQPMPSYPLYSSLMFCHSQVPISIVTKHLAQPWFSLILQSWPRHWSSLVGCIISIDGNKVAAFYPLAPHTLVTGSQPSRKVNSPSLVSICFLPLSYYPSLFQHPWPSPSPFIWP